MLFRARETSHEGIESANTSQALKEFIRQERESREDHVSICWISIMMVMMFLILVLLMIEFHLAAPKNRHPTESAFYCHALPLFNVLTRDRLGSVLPPTCHSAVTLLPKHHSVHRVLK
jgi:hypothetical protein